MQLIINLDNTGLTPQDLNIFTVDVAARLTPFGIKHSDISIDLEAQTR